MIEITGVAATITVTILKPIITAIIRNHDFNGGLAKRGVFFGGFARFYIKSVL